METMRIRSLLIFLLLISILSCSTSENYIYYNYGGTTLTRIDEGNEIFLYYGKFDSRDSLPDAYLKATYHGFDGGVNCLLIFKDNGNVEIVRISGSLDITNMGEKLRLIDFKSNRDFINWHDKKRGNYKNIIQLDNALKYEKKWNIKNHTNVKAQYPK